MKNRIFVLGDIHGDFRPVRDLYIRLQSKKSTHIKDNEKPILILLGDSGLNYFFNERDKNTKEKLKKYPFIYFVIRGNHEERPSICMKNNPNEWTYEKFFDTEVYVEKEYPYIKYAPDFVCQCNIDGYKTLIVPGAYSVDKEYRLINQWSWFEGEQLTKEEKEQGLRLIKENNEYDLVLSHTCPMTFEPTDLFLPIVDQSKVDKSMELYLDEIVRAVDYKTWLWGHYHAFRPIFRSGRRNCMLFNDLAIELNELMETKSVKDIILY